MFSLTQLLYEISELGEAIGVDFAESWKNYKEGIKDEILDCKRRG